MRTFIKKLLVGGLFIMLVSPVFACSNNEFEYNGNCIESKFEIETTTDTTNFKFFLTAQGTYYIDWGDGWVDKITRNQTFDKSLYEYDNTVLYSHNYGSAGSRTIRIGGQSGATTPNTTPSGYNTKGPVFNFGGFGASNSITGTPENVLKIRGSLGALFPTMSGNVIYSRQPRFEYAFRGCENMIGTDIPDPNYNDGTKYAIPPTLFEGITGAPVSNMFRETFEGCSSLTGTIPENLFAGINGNITSYMFYLTFGGCSGLTGEIPENLFGRTINDTYYGIQGTPAEGMFDGTFDDCSGLTGEIPENLFGRTINGTYYGIQGDPQPYMFRLTFANCYGLTGTVPNNLFAGINNDPSKKATDQMAGIFWGCSGLEWCPITSIYYITGFEDDWDATRSCTACADGQIADITGTTCIEPEYSFTVTTIPNVHSVSFTIAASGTWFVNCNNEDYGYYIEKLDATPEQHSCWYGDTPGSHTIRFSGQANGYSTSSDLYDTSTGTELLNSAISFNDESGIFGISGSLGAIFPTLSNNTENLSGSDLLAVQPRFFQTFSNLANLTGTIPNELFTGVYGKPVEGMFAFAFMNSPNIFGPIPTNLFAGITGTEAPGMFYQTFNQDTNLGKNAVNGTSTYYIPPTLFADINRDADNTYNYSMFDGTGLLTSCESMNNMTVYTTGYEDYFNNKVSCIGNKEVVCPLNTSLNDGQCESCSGSNCPTTATIFNCNTPANSTHSACTSFNCPSVESIYDIAEWFHGNLLGSAVYDIDNNEETTNTDCMIGLVAWDENNDEEFERCISAYYIKLTPEEELREDWGDNYEQLYTYYVGTPCDYGKLDLKYMLCRYNESAQSYTDCSTMMTVCDDDKLGGVLDVWEGNPLLPFVYDGLNQQSVNINSFNQDLTLMSDISDWGRYNTCQATSSGFTCASPKIELSILGAPMCLIPGLADSNSTGLTVSHNGNKYHLLLSTSEQVIHTGSEHKIIIQTDSGTYYVHDESVNE